jgi:putative protease
METLIGHVTHYYNHIGVAVLKLSNQLKVGDAIHILGHTSDFDQFVSSLEIRHHKILTGKPGDDVALRVDEAVREKDEVYRVVEAL